MMVTCYNLLLPVVLCCFLQFYAWPLRQMVFLTSCVIRGGSGVFQLYAWPLLETVFSEVLTRDEWLMLWDHVVSNPPSFLLMLTAAYSVCARGPLMQCTELDDFQVRVCVCVCVCVCVGGGGGGCMYACVGLCVCMCMYACVCVCIFVCMWGGVMHVCVCMCMHAVSVCLCVPTLYLTLLLAEAISVIVILLMHSK